MNYYPQNLMKMWEPWGQVKLGEGWDATKPPEKEIRCRLIGPLLAGRS